MRWQLMSQIGTTQYPRFAIPKEIRLASHDRERIWSWRAALLLMLSWCLWPG